ncbi:MAG TPA: M20 family metallopeptidase [Actinocrinis sp.]|nr:M20 family metallopeptidase [Actinocrinis sp.]
MDTGIDHEVGLQLEPFLATAAELLAMPSTDDRPDQLRRAVDFVIALVGPGFVVERFESNGKPSALLYPERHRDHAPDGAMATRPRFPVILNGHLDVVPAEPDQFRPRREGGRLYARGAQDMKVSALLEALVFRDVAARLPYPVALQLVADEETGGRDGTLYQLQQGVSGDFVVIGENSRLDIVTGTKGLAQARLLATGRDDHGAYPWLGDNALMKIVNTAARLMAAYPTPTQEIRRTTVNLARVHTPNQAVNRIPGRAEAWLDIRFPAGDEDFSGRTYAEIARHLSSFCDPGIEVVVDDYSPPQYVDQDRPEVLALRKAAQNQGFRGDYLYKHGSSDGGFYSELGIAAVAFGVGGAGQHGPDEYLDIDTVVPYYLALQEFLEQLVLSADG